MLSNLAATLRSLGRRWRSSVTEAPPRRALSISKRALGPDHPDVATAFSNLASTLRFLGRSAEAEAPLRRALAIFERALGPDQPEVATALSNLAVTLRFLATGCGF